MFISIQFCLHFFHLFYTLFFIAPRDIQFFFDILLQADPNGNVFAIDLYQTSIISLAEMLRILPALWNNSYSNKRSIVMQKGIIFFSIWFAKTLEKVTWTDFLLFLSSDFYFLAPAHDVSCNCYLLLSTKIQHIIVW